MAIQQYTSSTSRALLLYLCLMFCIFNILHFVVCLFSLMDLESVGEEGWETFVIGGVTYRRCWISFFKLLMKRNQQRLSIFLKGKVIFHDYVLILIAYTYSCKHHFFYRTFINFPWKTKLGPSLVKLKNLTGLCPTKLKWFHGNENWDDACKPSLK